MPIGESLPPSYAPFSSVSVAAPILEIEEVKMYVIIDRASSETLGRFEDLTAARGMLIDFYRLHPPAARWLEIAIEREPSDLTLLEAA
jgi:hypothetical protein